MRLVIMFTLIVTAMSCNVPDKTPSSILGTYHPVDTLISPQWLDSVSCNETIVEIDFQNFDNLWSVNETYKSMEGLKYVVDSIHDEGKKVVALWDATKTSFECSWTFSNRDFYYQDSKGILIGKLQWADAAKTGLQYQMTTAMLHWIESVGIDGYKCVNASKVPLWYWESFRRNTDSRGLGTVLLADSIHESYNVRAFDKVVEDE